jgi:cytochrome c551/c552
VKARTAVDVLAAALHESRDVLVADRTKWIFEDEGPTSCHAIAEAMLGRMKRSPDVETLRKALSK